MRSNRIRLGVNLDHIAFIKKSRDTLYPSLADAVKITEDAGADLITIHLREDRRHIQDSDAFEVRDCAKTLNFEMANTMEMIEFALKLKPDFCCIVPEKREEKTTEKVFSKKNQVKKAPNSNERNSVLLVKLKQSQQTTLIRVLRRKSRPCEFAFKEEEHKETRRIKKCPRTRSYWTNFPALKAKEIQNSRSMSS